MAPRNRPADNGDDDGVDGVSGDRREEIRDELLVLSPDEIPDYIATLSGAGELGVAQEWLVQNGLSPYSPPSSEGNAVPGAPDPSFDAPVPVDQLSDQTEVSDAGQVLYDPLSSLYQPAPPGTQTPNSPPASEQVLQIQNAIDSHPDNPNPSTPTSPPLSEGATNAAPDFEPAGTQHTYDTSVSEAHDYLVGIVVAADQQGNSVVTTDMINAVIGMMPEGAQRADWVSDVLSGVQEEASAQRATEQEAAGEAPTGLNPSTFLDGQGGTPIWLLAATGYGELTDQQQERLVDYFNDLNGTNLRTYDELVASGALGAQTDRAAPSALVQRVVEGAILAAEPVEELRIDLPGVRDPIHVSLEDQNILRGSYGLSTDGIVRLARLGNLQPRLDPNTGQARPTNLFELAAISAAYGMQEGLADQRAREQKIAQLQSQLEGTPGNWPSRSEWVQSAEYAEIQQQITQLQRMNSPTSGGGPNQPGVMGAYNNYQRGLDQYGQNQTLALISTVNPGLAMRIAATGGDPDKLNSADSAAAWDLLIKSGVAERDKRSGFRPDDYIMSQFASYFGMDGRGGGGGGGGGAGKQRRLIDPEGVKQQVQGLWQGLFLSDAPESAIKGITAALQESLDKAPPGMEFDVSARIQDWLKGQGQYRELYGKKAPGTSEQDYQAQFLAGSASILGNETADPESIKSGMRTGQYQTTVGSAFAGGMKGGDNSTLQERLARAANLVAANT